MVQDNEKNTQTSNKTPAQQKCVNPNCSEPWKELNEDNFYWRKDNQRWWSECIECILQKRKEYYQKNRLEKIKYVQDYRQLHKEEIAKYKAQYYLDNKEKLTKYKRQWYEDNKNDRKQYEKHYREDNREKIAIDKREYIKNKRKNDLIFKLKDRISCSIYSSLNKTGSSKNGNKTWIEFIDYIPQDLQKYIESLFESWMSWDNWGVYDPITWDDNDKSTWRWQLDHIIPVSHFNLINPDETPNIEEIRKCWAFSNLRPYSAKLNIMEGNNR